MAYRLALYDVQEYFDITGLNTIDGFEDIDDKSLQDIILFTSEFDDEFELKETLLEANLITSEVANGKFAINYYRGNSHKAEKLPYGIIYNKDKDLLDYKKLFSFYKRNQRNTEFIDIFINKFYNYLKNTPLFEDIVIIYHGNSRLKKGELLSTSARPAMEHFLQRYCLSKTKDGQIKINFLHLRELAMLSINYQNNKDNKLKQKSIKQMLEELKMELEHYKTLLDDSALTNEQINEYNDKITRLERTKRDYI